MREEGPNETSGAERDDDPSNQAPPEERADTVGEQPVGRHADRIATRADQQPVVAGGRQPIDAEGTTEPSVPPSAHPADRPAPDDRPVDEPDPGQFDEAGDGSATRAATALSITDPTPHSPSTDGPPIDGPPIDGPPTRPDAEPENATDRTDTVLRATDAGVRGSRGWAFRHVELAARPGQLVAVVGDSGSGRSTLLLALAGRLRLTTGTIVVAGAELPAGRPPRAAARTAREAVAVARLAEHIGLDPDLTMVANLRAAADWAGIALSDAEDRFARWRDRAGLELCPRTPVGELPALEATAAHLLLATLGNPAAIVLDDADHRLTAEQRDRFRVLARDVADTGPTVVTATLDEPAGADVYVRLTAPEPSTTHPDRPSSRPDGQNGGNQGDEDLGEDDEEGQR